MIAHCPKCGKFAAEIDRCTTIEHERYFIWKHHYRRTICWFECRLCKCGFQKTTEERLR